MIFRSKAPVRIDFAGGWSDVALFCQETPGYVVGAAISLYSYVTVKSLPKATEEADGRHGYFCTHKIDNNGVKIYSADFDLYQEAANIKELEYDGSIDLIKAAVKHSRRGGQEIITRCDAPAGSGLGSSASMGVALCGALCKDLELPYEYAEKASQIERHELNILGGKQDQYLAAYGGLNAMEFHGEQVRINRLSVTKDTLQELQKHLVLCYTGQSRLSSDIHQRVVSNFKTIEKTRKAIAHLKRIAREMQTALYQERLEGFAELMTENWEYQKQLHASVTTSDIDDLFDLAFKNGAAGGKACGAGGGGCLVFYCPDTEHQVRKALTDAGMQILNSQFDFDGLQTWMVMGL